MAGVTIGKYAIVGAASVVAHDVGDYEVVVGSPAKVLKTLDKEKFEKQEAIMETWYYVVESIDGDYANLKRTDIESDELERVASAKGWVDICKGWNGELSISG